MARSPLSDAGEANAERGSMGPEEALGDEAVDPLTGGSKGIPTRT